MPLRFLTVAMLLIGLTASGRTPDQDADTADLIAILRAIHVDRCGLFNWRGPSGPVVISDRPSPTPFNEIKNRPFERFGIALQPRAPAGTLWPHVTLCPGIGVVDHKRLESLVAYEDAAYDHVGAFTLAFGEASYEEISLPAFSADGNRAVVYRAHMCPLCGEGIYFEVLRTPYGWRVSRREQVWVS